MLFSAFSAFIGGVLSFLSPCVLPLVPAYQAFLIGALPSDIQDDPRAFRRALLQTTACFCAGFSLIFIMLGLGAAGISAFLLPHKVMLTRIGGVVLILLGCHLLISVWGSSLIRILQNEKRWHYNGTIAWLPLKAFIAGVAFAAGWTPCIGPVLAWVLTLAAGTGQALQGVFLLTCYAVGLAIPFMLSALYVRPFARFLKKFRAAAHIVNAIAGALLIGTGVLMFTDSLGIWSNTLLEWIPAFAKLG